MVNGDWNRDKTRDEIDPNQKLCESSPLNKAKKVRHPFNSDRNDGKKYGNFFQHKPKEPGDAVHGAGATGQDGQTWGKKIASRKYYLPSSRL